MSPSALDKHFAKMNGASSSGNATAPKRSTSPRPPMRRQRSRSPKRRTNNTSNAIIGTASSGNNNDMPPPLTNSIDEDHTEHFGIEGDDTDLSINTTNTGNIRISRKARKDIEASGDGVKTKSIVKNFRLSRNHSRVLYNDARSPSPSRKLLAAEIAVAAARREYEGPYVPEPPPLEQTPLILMRFTDKATSKMIHLIENRLRKSGLIIYDKVEDTDEPHSTYLYLSAAQEALETFAEQIRWMKRTNDTKVVEYFTVPNRRKFVSKKKKRPGAVSTRLHEREVTPHRTCMGGDELFTSNEWCHLAFRLLDSVEVWLENESSKDLNLMLMLRDENQVPPPPPPPASSPGGDRTAQSRRGKRPSFTRQNSSSRSVNSQGKGSNHGKMPNRRNFRRQTSMGNLSGPSSGLPNGSGGGPRRGNLARQKSMMMQRVSKAGKRSKSLRHVLQANEFVDVVTPVHWGPARKAIVTETLKPTQLMPPVQDIRNYYGEDVAFYFAWMGTLSNWLVVLGGMGAITVALQWIRNDELDEDEFTPMYGVFTFLWGVLFLRFWERHEHRLAYRWGTYSLSLYDKQKCLTTRPEFKGRLRISPVTGEYETYYPASKRRIQYAISALVTTVMLGVAFWMMILSLNMQGFVHPERNPDRWNHDNPHPFHYPSFAVLSEKGYMFDATHRWKSFLPSVLHVALIFTLNNIYRVIAELLTEWENHETEASYRTSLIVKRFLFEAFDCYVALFYLAFYERDVDRLHMELVTVFNIDTFRRLTMECFIPLVSQRLSKWLNPHHHTHLVSEADEELEAEEAAMMGDESAVDKSSKDNEANAESKNVGSPSSVATASTISSSESETEKKAYSKAERSKPASVPPTKRGAASQLRSQDIQEGYRPPTMAELADEADLEEYEAFDDYMEIVIQFGYVTLFASAYPLASLVALAANWVEIRSDCFKLAKVCRRPRSLRADGIGVWKTLLSCVVWTSALTNCLIVGFTSDQMREFLPAFYVDDGHGDSKLVNDKGWIAVFVIFGLERILIVLGLLIYAIIPEVPEDVNDEVERLQYIRAQEHEEVLRQVMRKRANKKKN